MIFGTPIPFTEALQSHAGRALLPTTLRTAGLDQLGADIRRRAFFSAGVTMTEVLAPAYQGVGKLLEGASDQATIRLGLKSVLDELGYQPGFGERSTILDLSSDARLNLILETNVQLAEGYGSFVQGQDPAVLDLWPAQELFRAEQRHIPRDWPARWRTAGGKIFGGRMIALKDSPVWAAISRFGHPWPPFDYNSGMDVRDVTRAEAMRLGLIDRDSQVKPQVIEFNQGLQAAPAAAPAELRGALEATGLGRFNDAGVFVANERRAA